MIGQNELKILRALAESSYNCIYIIQDGKVRFINRHAEIYGGVMAAEVIDQMDSITFVHPDDRPAARENAIKMLKGERTSPYELRCCGRDGKIRWLIETVTPVIFRGRPAVLANSMDITEIKEARSKLVQFKDLESSILDATPVAIIGQQDREIIFANNAVESIFGWPVKELIGRDMRVLYRNDRDYKRLGTKIFQILNKQRNFMEPEYPFQCRDGTKILCSVHAARIGKTLLDRKIVVSFDDITEQKKAESALQERTRILEEINTALNVLLKKREDDKRNIEENIMSNIKASIMPCIELIKKNKLDRKTQMSLETIESGLKNMISPFSKTLSSSYLGLTPREVLIAGMLRDGKATKEIAALLNTTVRGVEFHRENIRAKLGLKYKKENLVLHLRTLKIED